MITRGGAAGDTLAGVSHRPPSPEQVAALLRGRGIGEVDASTRRRAEYSSDASNYRVVPAAVAFPRDADEVEAVLTACRAEGLPLTLRGAGTSVAGNAVGPGVVLDTSRHLRTVEALDPQARTAVVQPGVVLDDLQRAAAPHGLRFGPDPSTHDRCTLGGMIGNNACGSRAIAYGRTSDNVLSLDVVTGAGVRLRAGAGPGQLPAVDALAARHRATIRTELGRFSRQVSGYALEHLLPEHGQHLARALVGSEGTLAVLLRATVSLVERPAATTLVVLGYPDLAAAADAVPTLLPHRPLAVEGMDARLVGTVVGRRGPGAVPALPAAGAWLLVEVGGPDPGAASAAAARLLPDVDAGAAVVLDGAAAAAVWRVREDGAGLAGRTPDGRPAWPGWEDAAVPPERLGSYLRAFAALTAEHGVDGITYGHLGDGCVHARLDLPVQGAPQRLRAFLHDAAVLVAEHGGSLSGEHGDGRARGELLPLMYSPAAIAAFTELKQVFDPQDVLNPGVLVRPRPVDADLRLATAGRPPPATAPGHTYPDDGGQLFTAVHRCVGIGRCRVAQPGPGLVMCPSYRATRDEKDSTRGRARVLQETRQRHPRHRRLAGRGGARGPRAVPVVQGLLE